MKKRLIHLVILIASIGLIINLSRDIPRLLGAGDQVELAERRLQELEEDHQKLLTKREYYQSEEFVEKEARDKLNMSRPEETVVILPPDVGQLLGQSERKSMPEITNWEKWWALFF